MARNESELTYMPSVLDRLIDEESQGTANQPWYGIREMVQTLQRDLDNLLNTQRTDLGMLDGFPEVETSIVSYGFRDIASLSANTGPEVEVIGRIIKDTIERSEPRIANVRVVVLDSGEGTDRNIRFRVEGSLNVNPAPDIAFTTTVELATGHQTVSSQS